MGVFAPTTRVTTGYCTFIKRIKKNDTSKVTPSYFKISKEKKIEVKEIPRCLIPHLLVVSTRKLKHNT